MLIVGNSIISDDIRDVKFCCNMEKCCGNCCVEGDYGAPLEEEEIKTIEKILPTVKKYLPLRALQVIEEQGFYTFDDENQLVTQIIDKKDCVFAFKNAEGHTCCVFQKLFTEQKIDFIKPLSCHLYPIRINKYDEMTVLNYHRWDICEGALEKGRKDGIALYDYCPQPMIRRFGQAWYGELERTINNNI